MVVFKPMLTNEELDEKHVGRLKNVKNQFVAKEQEIVGRAKKKGMDWMEKAGGRVEVEKTLRKDAWVEFEAARKDRPMRANRFVNDKGQMDEDDDATFSAADIPKGEEVVEEAEADNDRPIFEDADKPTGGFIVLGMHRSGTSMLAGLLNEGFGYKVGGPLIGAAFDNEKGFFELLPAVLQNDEFMYAQRVNWAGNMANYDADKAIVAYKSGAMNFDRGVNALKVLNDVNMRPWMQKDPRMCITLRTWLPLLNTKPAVLFTYRHPLEVAMSLKKREHFTVQRGLRLWIVYNKLAVNNSADLCRVLSSNDALLADPMGETDRIREELTTKCEVPPSPKRITQDIIDNFVDPKLQHNKKEMEDTASNMDVIEKHGDCDVRDYKSEFPEGSANKDMEKNMYLKAMKIYCDFQSGKAYEDDYEWPDLD